jgi:PAS domain-containing protein
MAFAERKGLEHIWLFKRSDENCLRRQAKSEARLRTLTDNLPVLISYVDKDQRFRFSNAKYEEWYGTSPVDMIGKTVSGADGISSPCP